VFNIIRLKTFLASLIALMLVFTSPIYALDNSFLAASPSTSGSFLAGQQAFRDMRTEQAARFFLDASESEWGNPAIVEQAFIALTADGRIEDAAALAQHLIEIDPTNEIARLLLGTLAIKERRYTSAIKQLDNVKNGNFTTITAIILKAWALIGEDKFTSSQILLDELSKAGLDNFLLFHRTLMADVAGNKELALKYAMQTYENDAYVSRVVETYARILANSSKFSQAQSIIAEYKKKNLAHPLIDEVSKKIDAKIRPGKTASTVQEGASEIYHGIGVALSNEGRNELAMLFFQLGIYLNPNAQMTIMALAQLLERAELYEEANKIYSQLNKNLAFKSSAMINIAQNLDAMGDRDEAIRKLKNIVVISPDNLDAISALGDLYRYDEKYSLAIKAYSKALKIVGGQNPRDWRFYYVRGISYERSNQWPKAEADFLMALKLNPGHPQVLNYLGYSWVDKGMNLEPALELIYQAVEASHNDGYIVDSLGWAYYKLNRIDEAVEVLEQAVDLLPNDPEINDHLGDAYWKVGRKNEARFQWTIAIDVDQKGDVTKRAEKKLQNVQDFQDPFKNQ